MRKRFGGKGKILYPERKRERNEGIGEDLMGL